MPRSIAISILAVFATACTSACFADDYPLFDFDDTLELVLEVPMRTLLRSARKNPLLDGQLHFVDPDGNNVTINLTMTTRGKSRLEHCSFPPLSITLNEEQTPSTLFEGQKKLKIVTHCRSGATYQRYLQQEYGIYKAYNVLSDHSFRVLMLNATYRDTEKKRRDEVVPGFFIESDDEVADRLGMTKIDTKTIASKQFDIAETNKFELFQYMIANTDWAIKKGPGTDDCCHNGKVIGHPGSDNNWVILPYDFDQAGLINTDYALPAVGLGIRNVKQRLYRGRCGHNERLDDTIALFNELRSELEAALAAEALKEKDRRRTLKYLDGFFVTINDPKKRNKQIIGKCRGA
jgi:hypothetical protein